MIAPHVSTRAELRKSKVISAPQNFSHVAHLGSDAFVNVQDWSVFATFDPISFLKLMIENLKHFRSN